MLLCFCAWRKSLFHIGCEWVRMWTRDALQHTQTPALDRSAIETKLREELIFLLWAEGQRARNHLTYINYSNDLSQNFKGQVMQP